MSKPAPLTDKVVTVCFAPDEDADWFAASERGKASCTPTARRPAATASATAASSAG